MRYHRMRVSEVTGTVRSLMAAGQDAGSLPEGEPATELERCSAKYITTRAGKLHIRYEKSNAELRERRLTIAGFRDAAHVDSAFAHLDRFAEGCVDRLMERFPSHKATLAFRLFDNSLGVFSRGIQTHMPQYGHPFLCRSSLFH